MRVKSETNNRSGIVTENMTSATPDQVVGTTFKNVQVNENGEFVVVNQVVADKSYLYNVNTWCQSIAYSLFSSGTNCVWQSGNTYLASPITFPSIPAPSQTAPSWYKRVADIVLKWVNFNQTSQNVSVGHYLSINWIWWHLIWWTTWVSQSWQSPKENIWTIIWRDINQSWTSPVALTLFLRPDWATTLSITNPDYRLSVEYHIRLAKI